MKKRTGQLSFPSPACAYQAPPGLLQRPADSVVKHTFIFPTSLLPSYRTTSLHSMGLRRIHLIHPFPPSLRHAPIASWASTVSCANPSPSSTAPVVPASHRQLCEPSPTAHSSQAATVRCANPQPRPRPATVSCGNPQPRPQPRRPGRSPSVVRIPSLDHGSVAPPARPSSPRPSPSIANLLQKDFPPVFHLLGRDRIWYKPDFHETTPGSF